MAEVPDKVIGQARAAGLRRLNVDRRDPSFTPINRLSREVRAEYEVIAEWARQQVRAEVSRRYGEAEATYETVQGSYEEGRMDAFGELLTALDREDK